MKQTVEERLSAYRPQLPKPFGYGMLRLYTKCSAAFKKIRFSYEFYDLSYKGKPVILLAAHPSTSCYLPIIGGWRAGRLNPVINGRYFKSKLAYFATGILGGIPKQSFQNDFSTVRNMLSILKKGGSILLFPEGIESHSGSSMPITPGTAAFLKGAGYPVVLCKGYGEFLRAPFFSFSKRQGHSEFRYELLFTPEELRSSDADTISRKLLDRFRFNDFDWNGAHHYHYRAKNGFAEGLSRYLYRCPQCGAETMQEDRDELFCPDCGNRIRISDDYTLQPTEGSVLPYRSIDEWYKDERRIVREEIAAPNFAMEYQCRLRQHAETFSVPGAPQLLLGEGLVRIDATGVTYEGTINGEKSRLFFDIMNVPAFQATKYHMNNLCYKGVWWFFEPLNPAENVVKISIAAEELHFRVDEAWDQAARAMYD